MSEANVYAIASGKGGVGKTTTAMALGDCIAASGRSVILVDADLEMADIGTVLGISLDDKATLHDVLANNASITDAIYEINPNFDLLCGGSSLDDFSKGDPSQLERVVNSLKNNYDIMLLDTGGGLNHETVLPLGLADQTIIVSTPEETALHDSGKTKEMAEEVGGDIRGLILTRSHNANTDEIQDQLDIPLIGIIPEDDAVRDAQAAGEPVTTFAPNSPAAGAYIEATASLLGIAVSDIDIGPQPNEEEIPLEGTGTGSGSESTTTSGNEVEGSSQGESQQSLLRRIKKLLTP